MDYLTFIAIILILVAALYFSVRTERRVKDKYKKEAYRLLETSDPASKEFKDTVKGLRLYAGRLRKDQEAVQLINRLLEKHGHLLN